MKNKSTLRVLALSLGLSIANISPLGSPSARAATDTWSGATNGSWNTTSSNWLNDGSDTLFNSGNDALFTGTPTNNVTSATGLTIGAITLDSSFTGTVTLTGANTVTGPTTISGGILSMSATNQLGTSAITLNGGTLRSTAAVNFDTSPITVGANGGTINALNSANTFRFNTANSLLGSGTLTITGNGTLPLAGSTTQGVVVLNNSNTFNGNLTAQSGGLLEYGNASGLAAGATITAGNNGGVSASNVTVSNNVTVNNGGTLLFQNGNSGNFTGGITLSGSTTVRMQDWYAVTVRNGTISGAIAGTGTMNVIAGSGTGGVLTLSTSNSYSGGTNITRVAVVAANSFSLGSGSVTINSGNNGQIQLANGVNVGNSLTINGGGATSQGILYVPTSTNSATYSGNITLSGTAQAGAHLATVDALTKLTVSGNISGAPASGLTVRNGVVVLNGSNSYSGGTAAGNATSAMIQFGKTFSMPASGTVSAATGNTIAVNAGGTNEFTNATSGAGSIGGLLSGTGGQGAPVTWIAGESVGIDTTNASGTVTYGGNFLTSASNGLLKLGTGTLELTNGGTYTGIGLGGFALIARSGTMILNGGTHTVNGEVVVGGVFGTANGSAGLNASLLVNSGTMAITGFLSVGRGNGVGGVSSDLVLNNNAVVTAANMSAGFNASNAANLPKGTVTLNGTSSLTIGNAGQFTFAESAGSNFTMTLNNSSTVTLTGNGTATNRIIGQTGATGAVIINDSASFNAGGGTLNVGYQTGTGTLTINSGTFTTTGEVRVGASNVNGAFGGGSALVNQLGGTVTVGSLTVARSNDATGLLSGTVSIGAGTFTSTGNVFLGFQGSGTGSLSVTGGTFNANALLELGVTGTGHGVVTVNGGVLKSENDFLVGTSGAGGGVVTLTSGTINVATTTERWMKLNDNNTASGTVTVNGGLLNLNTNTDIRFTTNAAATGTNVFTLNNGTVQGQTGNANGVLSVNSIVDLNNAATGAANNTFNLNGGTLAIGQVLTTSNSGSAVFNFNGGTLKAAGNTGNFVDLGGASQSAKVQVGGAVIDSNGFSVTIPEALVTGSAAGGGLTKSGSGSLTLSGSNTYTGVTTVSSGTLALGGAGSVNSSSGITINGSGAKFLQTSSVASTPAITLTQGTLDGTGTTGAVTVGAGTGGIVANGNGTTAKLTLGSLTFNGAGTINLILAGDVTTTEGLTVTNGLTTSGGASSVTVNITPTLPLLTGTTYNLIGYGTSFTGNTTDFIYGGNTARLSGSFGNAANFITLTINGDTPKWTGLDAGGEWKVGSTGANSNWQLVSGGTPTDYVEGDVVLFDDSAAGTTSVNISTANVSPTSTTFNNSTKDYTVSSSGTFGIAGIGPLIKSGTGTVTIKNTNTYTGQTIINAGTVQVGDGTTDGSISTTSNIVNNGTLVYNRLGSFTYGGLISGTGVLVKSGTGTQILTAANTYNGGTTINAGTLNITQTTGSAATGTFDLSGGRLEFAPTANNFNLNNTINLSSSSATIGNVGSGAINLIGVLNGNSNPLNYVQPTGNSRLYFNTTSNSVSVFNILSGGLGFDLSVGNQGGAAPVVVSNGASFYFANASNTLFNNITLNGTGQNGIGALFFEGAAAPSILGTVTLASDSSIGGNNAAGNVTIGTAISGSASLTKVGVNKYTLADNNTYTGTTTISAGTLQLGNGGTTGSLLTSSTISIASTATLAVNRSNAVTQGVDFGVISGTTGILTQAGSGALTLAGANSITALNVNNATGTVDIGAGNLTLYNAGATTIHSTTGGTINASGGGKIVLAQNSATDGPDIGTDNGTTLTINAAITGTSAYENWTNTNNGTGVTVLTAANDYTGDTLVHGGVLSVAKIGNQGSTTSNLGQGTTIHFGVSTVSTGTLLYTGTGETTNRVVDLQGTTAGGIIDQSGASGNLKFTSNLTASGNGIKTLIFQGSTAGTGEFAGSIVNGGAATAVTKFGTGTWTLTGSSSFTGSLFARAGTLVIDTGGSVNNSTFSDVGLNTGDVANMTIKGTGSMTTNTDFNVGDVGDAIGVLNVQDSGILTITNLFIASANAAGSTATGTVNQSGGTVTQTGTAIGTFSVGGRILTGTGTAIYNLSGGTLNANAGIRLGDFGTGTFNQTGGQVNAKGGVNISRNVGGIGTYNLVSGTLAAFNVTSSTGTNATFNFNGGTLQAGGILSGTAFAPATAFMNTLTRANVRNGGAIINTNSNSVTIAQQLVHSNIGGDNATDGGLTKTGAGTLTLTAANTYTGATTITSGTLNLSNQLATQNSTVTMNGGSLVFDQTVGGNAFTFGGLAAASSGAGYDIALRNNAGSPAAVALTAGGNNASTTYSGVLSGSGSLTKTGTGTLTLTASNSYTGLTNVNAGALAFDVSETLSGGLNVLTSGTAILTAHTGGAANVKVLDITGLTIDGTTAFAGDGGKDVGAEIISPAPVPEPGTIGLLAVGAIGGLLLRRRNRKHGGKSGQ